MDPRRGQSAFVSPRLSLLAGYHGPYEGSFIPMARALGRTARARGWSAELVFGQAARDFGWYESLRSEAGADVITAPPGGRRATGDWMRARYSRPEPLVLHTHFTSFDLPAASLAAKRDRTAVLWHVHTPLTWGPLVGPRNLIKFGLVGRRVDAILASGPDPARGVIRAGAPRERVEVVGGGVEIERFPRVKPEERAAARARLGISESADVLLHFAWDWELKDGDLFLASVGELLARRPRGELVAMTVGSGDRARAGIERLGLTEAVRPVEQTERVNELYAAADLFVSSSRVEGQPFAVIEAILRGLPVVATDLPGHHDICNDLHSCRVVGRFPAELAAAADELLSRTPELAELDAASARERTASRFDLGAWSARMFDRYEWALAYGKPGLR